MPSDRYARYSSPTHGEGVRATAPIRRGERVMVMGGRRLPASAISDQMRCMQIGPDEWLAEDPARIDNEDDYTNHSCDPNLGFTAGTLEMFALRDVAPGEELTWDYSTSMNEPGWSVPCRCGSPACRGRIQSFCDLSPAQQARLLPLCLQYLRDLYAKGQI